MPEQPKVEAEAEKKPVESAKPSEAHPPKKRWETPRVIVSAARDSEVKGGNLPELSLSSSPNTGTPNS